MLLPNLFQRCLFPINPYFNLEEITEMSKCCTCNKHVFMPQKELGWHIKMALSVHPSRHPSVHHRKIMQIEKVHRSQNLRSHDQSLGHNWRSWVCFFWHNSTIEVNLITFLISWFKLIIKTLDTGWKQESANCQTKIQIVNCFLETNSLTPPKHPLYATEVR